MKSSSLERLGGSSPSFRNKNVPRGILGPQMAILAILFLMSVALSPCHAGKGDKYDQLKTIHGKIYEDVTITSVEADGLGYTSKSSIGKLMFRDLPPEIQRKYGYDPERAESYAASREKKRQRKMDSLQQEKARQDLVKASKEEVEARLERMRKTKPVKVFIEAFHVEKGMIYSVFQIKRNLDVVSSGSASIGGGGGGSRATTYTTLDPKSQPMIITEVDTSDLASGERWEGEVYDVGIVEYRGKRVRRYTADPKAWAENQ